MHWLWSMDSSQLWASLLSNNFAKYVIASLLMTGLNPFLALGLSQKWQNKRVWKILRCFNAIRQWDDIAQSWTWLTYIFAHFNSIEEGNENLLGLLHDSRIWTHFQFCSLNNIFYAVFARCANKFWLNKEKKCWCLNRGNKCLFYLSDPKTEIGNSFDMTFSGMTFFNNCLLDCKNKHICMDKRQTGTNIPMRIVCVVVNKKPQSWEEMTFGRVCHAKGHGLRK